jgi:hypothetical protein
LPTKRRPVSLLRLLADRKESDLGLLDSQDLLREEGAHLRELNEVLRPRIGVRARVEEYRGTSHGRQRHGDRGPVHRREPADLDEAGRESCARVPRRDDGVGFALADGAAGEEEGALALLAHRVRRLLAHRHHLVGVDDRKLAGERLEPLPASVQHGLDLVRRSLDGARDDLLRRSIAAHGVDGDADPGHVSMERESRAARPRGRDRYRRSGRRDEGASAGGTAGTRRAQAGSACGWPAACRGATWRSFASERP